MELPKPINKKHIDRVEEFSRSTSLTVFEIHRAAAEIIPGYLLANMMSPALWKWRETRPMHDNEGNLRGANRRLKDLQREFHWYTFTNDMSKPGGDYWGLLNFDEEEKRLGKDFIQTIRKDYDETLNYLLELDSESQFGQIVLQDFYKQGYFPRLKNETIEGMNAYQRICPMGKGSGKCVALAMLWASSLAVCSRFPLDQIIIVANKAHLFVFLDDGETVNLFNNAKWYNHTRINNESELAVQAKTVATGSDVMFIYIPGKGMCDIYNGFSEVERDTIENVANRCSEFLGSPLMVGDLDQVEFTVNESSLPDPSLFESREDYQQAVYALADQNPDSSYVHSKYAFRDWRNTEPQVYAYAAMRDYEVGERAKGVTTVEDALQVVDSVDSADSIFGSRDRIALPDETLLFGAGDDRDRALLLFSLIQKSPIETDSLLIGFSDDSSYVCCNNVWIDVLAMKAVEGQPGGLTHMFDHQFSWEPGQLNENAKVSTEVSCYDSYDSIEFSADVTETEELPQFLEEMIHIKVITPQGAEQLLQELKITDVESLRHAALDKKIQRLNGFCTTEEEKILRSIEEMAAGV